MINEKKSQWGLSITIPKLLLKKKTKIQVKNVFTKLKTKTIFEKLQLLDVLFQNLLKIANYFQMMVPQVDMAIQSEFSNPIRFDSI